MTRCLTPIVRMNNVGEVEYLIKMISWADICHVHKLINTAVRYSRGASWSIDLTALLYS